MKRERESGRGEGSHHHHRESPTHSEAAREHKSAAPATVSVFVITCSDSRDASRDESGEAIRAALEAAGHSVRGYRVVRDDAEQIRSAIESAAESGASAVILNGGTGIGRRDNSVEVVEQLLEKRLPGFGELFRYLSFKQIGSPAMMSRAVAGTYRRMVLFALPGSPQAAGLALEALILPELGHAVRELSR